MAWLFPPLQKMVEYRDGDTIITVPAKSGTTWTMNIFYQLREGGNPSFGDIYAEVPWVEFKERPDQPNEELLERWKKMPKNVPRAFKTHASPGPMHDFCDNLKYVVVMRNPEEAMVSLKPFFEQHSQRLWDLWEARDMKSFMVRPDLSFEAWFYEVALKWKPGPPDAPDVPGGMTTVFFWSFIEGWWSYRNKPNVLMMHFTDMKRDHEGSVRKIAKFLGYTPTAEQWPNILNYTSFEWMKENEDKFEARTISPVPLLNKGAMVRTGAVGKQTQDGMTPKVSATMREFMEKMVTDPAARKWMYEGGPLPPKSPDCSSCFRWLLGGS